MTQGSWIFLHTLGDDRSRLHPVIREQSIHGPQPDPKGACHELALASSRGRLWQVLMRRGSSGN